MGFKVFEITETEEFGEVGEEVNFIGETELELLIFWTVSAHLLKILHARENILCNLIFMPFFENH